MFLGALKDKATAIQEKLDLDDGLSSGWGKKRPRRWLYSKFVTTEYNERYGNEHTDKLNSDKLNTDSVLCSKWICVICCFRSFCIQEGIRWRWKQTKRYKKSLKTDECEPQ